MDKNQRDAEYKYIYDRLKENWPFSEIGKAMKISRSAVAGRVYRMRKAGYLLPTEKQVRVTIRPPFTAVILPPPLPPAKIYIPEHGGVDLIDLKERGCRYPVRSEGSRHWFCNDDKKDGSSYCERHHALTWVKSRINPKTSGHYRGPS
jgi:hypothetical protein